MQKRIQDAAQSTDETYEIQVGVLKAVDEELDRLLEFDTSTVGDVRFIGALNNAKFMTDKYLDDRHNGYIANLEADLSIFDCLQDVEGMIHARRFKPSGNCKSSFAPSADVHSKP